MQISVKINGIDEVLRNLSNANVAQLFSDAANISVAEVRKNAAVEVPKRTHQLEHSHQIKASTARSLSAEVFTDKEYAVPVHEGHMIVAFGRNTGRNHPANPWMDRSVDKAESSIDKYFSEAADKVAEALTK